MGVGVPGGGEGVAVEAELELRWGLGDLHTVHIHTHHNMCTYMYTYGCIQGAGVEIFTVLHV